MVCLSLHIMLPLLRTFPAFTSLLHLYPPYQRLQHWPAVHVSRFYFVAARAVPRPNSMFSELATTKKASAMKLAKRTPNRTPTDRCSSGNAAPSTSRTPATAPRTAIHRHSARRVQISHDAANTISAAGAPIVAIDTESRYRSVRSVESEISGLPPASATALRKNFDASPTTKIASPAPKISRDRIRGSLSVAPSRL